MEGNRYPGTSVKTASTAYVWISVTFHDFSEVFFSCYCGHTLNDGLCLWKGASFTGTNRCSGCDHGNRRRTPQRSRGRYTRYPDTYVWQIASPLLQQSQLKSLKQRAFVPLRGTTDWGHGQVCRWCNIKTALQSASTPCMQTACLEPPSPGRLGQDQGVG